jgi:hypothetical protein
MNELWKDIPGYVGYYQISDLGRVRGLERESFNGVGSYTIKSKILKEHPGGKMGYMGVSLCKEGKPKTFRVHVLAALTFLGERPEGYHVGHLDGNPTNNRASNLRYLTVKENIQQSYKDSGLGANRNNGKLIEYGGESLSLSQWAKKLGCNRDSLAHRKESGWSIEKMLTQPFLTRASNPSVCDRKGLNA